ncbi:MAG: hypothetical protein BWZ10_02707 [candidate division BRC1 bacterium ADurb.BinA364]|nr:MAG: hypothetical protein BWZ10_02707 [candidate division BRC1 bacterium ADurb.BinA364]
MNRHDIDPVIQVFAEAAFGDFAFQVFVGGADQPAAYPHRARSAQARSLHLLHGFQNFALGFARKLGDFVEKQRALAGQLEPALALRHGAGERSALVAEQLRLEQVVVGQRRAIDVEKRLAGARAGQMHRAGDQFLADAGFAGNQRQRVAGRQVADFVLDAPHRLALADQTGEGLAGFELRSQKPVFVEQAALLQRLAQPDEGFALFRFLGDIVGGAQLHRLDGGFDRVDRSQHYHRQIGVESLDIAGADGAQQLDPAHARHLDVGDDKIEKSGAHPFERGGSGVGDFDFEALGSQIASHALGESPVVLDKQQAPAARLGRFRHEIASFPRTWQRGAIARRSPMAAGRCKAQDCLAFPRRLQWPRGWRKDDRRRGLPGALDSGADLWHAIRIGFFGRRTAPRPGKSRAGESERAAKR